MFDGMLDRMLDGRLDRMFDGRLDRMFDAMFDSIALSRMLDDMPVDDKVRDRCTLLAAFLAMV